MKCPSCGGLDIRVSKRSPRFSFLYEVRGYERYRCRGCRHAFWDKPPANTDESIRRKRQRGWSGSIQSQARRRVIEIAVFVTMLLIFVMAIRYFINKGDSPSPAGLLLLSSLSSQTPVSTAEC
ncbi:MAG: hypothetical protein WBW33_15810 [Bryobacteraceae bacterium]